MRINVTGMHNKKSRLNKISNADATVPAGDLDIMDNLTLTKCCSTNARFFTWTKKLNRRDWQRKLVGIKRGLALDQKLVLDQKLNMAEHVHDSACDEGAKKGTSGQVALVELWLLSHKKQWLH